MKNIKLNVSSYLGMALSASLLLLSLSSNAGTLSDFFNSHPDLNDNLAVHVAISKFADMEASGQARREGGDAKELLKTNGDSYGLLGFRRVKQSCQYSESADVLGLSAADCSIVLNQNL
ncbi:hypothetical protein [Rosenbergiella collisarenosi]|uniref:hypothetical protein n=1 Tax=Rosenbergiella collisarenosi TaxID=1544695 RepID=UPI001FD29810|nr:hypothetical protein [Rosenbergiella collisarenosi]